MSLPIPTVAADAADACRECALAPDRRAFLKRASLAALGALISVGVPGELAAAVVPRVISARGRAGADLRYPIPAEDGVHIDSANEVILVRWKNAVYAFNLACPHQHVALHWSAADAQFQCPKHRSKYQADGTFISGRATRNMDRFSVLRSGTEVVVNVSAMHKSDADSGEWAAAVVPATPPA